MQTPDKRKYSLRLKERFAWYDTVGSQMWHDFPAGAEITDEARAAAERLIRAAS